MECLECVIEDEEVMRNIMSSMIAEWFRIICSRMHRSTSNNGKGCLPVDTREGAGVGVSGTLPTGLWVGAPVPIEMGAVVVLETGDAVGAMATGGSVGVDVTRTEGEIVGVPVLAGTGGIVGDDVMRTEGEIVGVPVLIGTGGIVGDDVVRTEGD